MIFHRSIVTDQRGAVAILAGFLLIPLIAFIGGAIDLVRVFQLESKLQSALDNAALSAASLTNNQSIDQVINEYIAANLGDAESQIHNLTISPTSDISSNTREVIINAQGTIPALFLGVVGIDSLPVGATATAFQGRETVEIAMVLDVSFSMRGAKLASLEDAAIAFVEQVLTEETMERTTISLIPYGGSVNIEPLFDSYVIPLDDPDVNLDPSTSEYRDADFAHEKFRFTSGTHCLDYADDEFDEAVLPSNARSQVPDFVGAGKEPWCPADTSTVLLNSNNSTSLSTALQGLSLSAGTATDVGMSWGLKALSPSWRGLLGGDQPDRPTDFDDENTLKAVVLMSDGATTAQRRPKDPSLGTIRVKVNGKKNVQEKRTKEESRDLLLSICEDAKSKDIVIFTIGFQIEAGTTEESDLQNCASSLGHFFLVEDLDIESAFESIASSISALRLTQ